MIKSYVFNSLDEANTYGDKVLASSKELNMLKEIFKSKPLHGPNKTTYKSFIRAMQRYIN